MPMWGLRDYMKAFGDSFKQFKKTAYTPGTTPIKAKSQKPIPHKPFLQNTPQRKSFYTIPEVEAMMPGTKKK